MGRKRVTLLYVTLGVFAAILLVFGGEVQAFQVMENMQLGGYVENRTAIRLHDHATHAMGWNQYEQGDFSMMMTTLFLDYFWKINENMTFTGIARGWYDAAYGLNDHKYDGTMPGPNPQNEDFWPGPDTLEMEGQFDFREYFLKSSVIRLQLI